MKSVFAIRRDERWQAAVLLVFILFFEYLIIAKFWVLFADYDHRTWLNFMRNYRMSGFDPITYSVLTDWHQGYDALRHPLLAFLMYPLYGFNQLLWWVTGGLGLWGMPTLPGRGLPSGPAGYHRWLTNT